MGGWTIVTSQKRCVNTHVWRGRVPSPTSAVTDECRHRRVPSPTSLGHPASSRLRLAQLHPCAALPPHGTRPRMSLDCRRGDVHARTNLPAAAHHARGQPSVAAATAATARASCRPPARPRPACGGQGLDGRLPVPRTAGGRGMVQTTNHAWVLKPVRGEISSIKYAEISMLPV